MKGPHFWGPSNVGHGENQCIYCLITNREAAAIGIMNTCDNAPGAGQPSRVEQLLKAVDESGPMHIVVGDGNMEDSHLAFVGQEMAKCGSTAEENELLGLLRRMSVDQRDEAWEACFK